MCWIYLSDAFLSIVADERHEDALLVRARRRGDIEAVFPVAEVVETPEADYRFRSTLLRKYVAGILVRRLLDINYPNFKNSIGWDPAGADRHDAYLAVWSTTRTRLTADPKPRPKRPGWLGGGEGGGEEGGDRALPFPPGDDGSGDSGGSGDAADFDPFSEDDEAEDRWLAHLGEPAARAEHHSPLSCSRDIGPGERTQAGEAEEEGGADAGPETMSEDEIDAHRNEASLRLCWLAETDWLSEIERSYASSEAVL
jgi:hypothetical protein